MDFGRHGSVFEPGSDPPPILSLWLPTFVRLRYKTGFFPVQHPQDFVCSEPPQSRLFFPRPWDSKFPHLKMRDVRLFPGPLLQGGLGWKRVLYFCATLLMEPLGPCFDRTKRVPPLDFPLVPLLELQPLLEREPHVRRVFSV